MPVMTGRGHGVLTTQRLPNGLEKQGTYNIDYDYNIL